MTIMPGPAAKAMTVHHFIYDKSTQFLLSTVWAALPHPVAHQKLRNDKLKCRAERIHFDHSMVVSVPM
ncbi:hypothetical protein [Undibacter mobilis]|uniref:hypothetical protein n=1 Tax=Undibacter mobilis TaxID=2292256 RepID=UPI0011C02167|nr:hypothetical protein [Undibacter mobilis]